MTAFRHLFFAACLSLSLPCSATTAVEDVSVNYLTSLHKSGPAGWPSAGHPYAPPIYNAERDQLIGISSFGNSIATPTMWGLTPVQGHYFALAEEVVGFTGFVAHPELDRLYSIDDKGAIFYVHSDGSNKTLVFDNQDGSLNNKPYIIPVFDDRARLLFIDSDHQTFSRLMRLESDNSVSEVFRFPSGADGQFAAANGFIVDGEQVYGLVGYRRGVPHYDTLSSDPNTRVGALYRLTLVEDGEPEFTILHNFTLAQGEIPWDTSGLSESRIGAYLIEDDRGFLYGGTSVGTCRTKGITSSGAAAQNRKSGLCGGEYNLYSGFDKDKLLIDTQAPHYDGPNPYGSVFRIHKDGSQFSLLHTFNGEDGSQPRGPMAITQDGYLYGTTLGGGVHKSELFDAKEGQEYPQDARNMSTDGTLFRIELESGAFEHLHSFKAGPGEDTDGKVPTGIMLADNGRLYGTTLYGGRGYTDVYGNTFINDTYGTVFEVDLAGQAPTGSVSISATPGSIKEGESAEITWSSHNAVDCNATGGVASDGWIPDSNVENAGSTTVSPVKGVYTFSINCADGDNGKRFGALATLYVDAEAKAKDGQSLSYGNGGAFGYCLAVLLGVYCVRRRGAVRGRR